MSEGTPKPSAERTHDGHEIAASLPTEPQTYEEMLAVLDGEDVSTYRKEAAQRTALLTEASKYLADKIVDAGQ